MKNKLNKNNLMTTYYDNGIYELEFHIDDKKVIITNIFESFHPDAWADEWYFENEDVLKDIIENATDNDLKIV